MNGFGKEKFAIGAKPLSPHFKALARTPRVCPSCLKHGLKLNSLELTWDGAVWKCDGCGWFQLEQAPENAKLGSRNEDAEMSGDGRFRVVRS